MKLSEWWKNKRERWWSAIVLRLLSARVMDDLVWKHRDRLATFVERNRLTRPLVYGPRSRLHVDDTAVVNNALFNTLGGEIHVGPQAFFGHDVCLLTGTHDVHLTGEARKESGGGAGRDVVVGPGRGWPRARWSSAPPSSAPTPWWASGPSSLATWSPAPSTPACRPGKSTRSGWGRRLTEDG